jgi:hypothetical protein
MENVIMNTGKLPIAPEVLKENGFDSISLIDDKYIEVVSDGKVVLRTYYTTAKGHGHFYINDTRYKVDNIRSVIPAAKAKEGQEAQPDEGKPTRKIDLTFSEKKPADDKKPPMKQEPVKFDDKPKHSEYDTIKTCIDLDIPVYLVGDAGTGKNHTLQEIAADLGMEFYFTNSIQQEYKITGFIDAGGKYHETEFYRAFKSGGLFFLDEMDASIPEVLVLLNAAIANRYFEFPNGKIDAHPQFRVVAAGNTMGSGANELYTGRLVLDSATLDRFAVIEFDYDKNIELSLAKGNVDLVNFIRSLREYCKKNGIRGTFSYRMIMAVQKLEAAKMDLTQVIKIAVVKGLDVDTIKTLKVANSGRYYHALETVKGAVKAV